MIRNHLKEYGSGPSAKPSKRTKRPGVGTGRGGDIGSEQEVLTNSEIVRAKNSMMHSGNEFSDKYVLPTKVVLVDRVLFGVSIPERFAKTAWRTSIAFWDGNKWSEYFKYVGNKYPKLDFKKYAEKLNNSTTYFPKIFQ